MAGLRQVLGVEVSPGNEHSAKHTQPGLLKILDALPPAKRPKLVRGDNAFGNDGMMTALDERNQPYLFKLKLSKNVKRHIGKLFSQPGWTDAGQGWEGLEGELALTGWQQKRRVVVLRRRLMGEIAVSAEGCPRPPAAICLRRIRPQDRQGHHWLRTCGPGDQHGL
jgi:hypothetical protein